MSLLNRSVRHLHLRAASDAHARRGLLRLEDALRCASLPDAGARLVFVRQLDLGRLDADAPSQTWALRIEAAMAQLPSQWVHGMDPAAGEAGVVWFRDAAQAHLALGLRLARGPALQEWFWQHAVPGLAASTGLRPALRQVLRSLLALPEAAAALPAWIVGMVEAGQLLPVAQALEGVDVAPLLRLLGGPAGPVHDDRPTRQAQEPALHGPAARTVDAPAAGLPPLVRLLVHRALQLTGRQDLLPWLGLLPRPDPLPLPAPAVRHQPAQRQAAVSGEGGAATPQPMPGVDWAASRQPQAAPARPAAPAPQGPPPEGPQPDVAPRVLGLAQAQAGTAPTAGAQAPPVAADAPVLPGPAPRRAPLPPTPAGWIGASPTAAGGALLLLPVWVRLGLPDWAERCGMEPRRLATWLWARCFARLALPPDDPAWALVGAWPAAATEGIAPPPALQQLRDLAVLIRDPGTAPSARPARWPARFMQPRGRDDLADAWLGLTRRWLRRRAGIGIASVVLRPASLAMGATHIDTVFDLQAADLRVRGAGLDVDPGWLPWLQRVVSFHYERGPAGEVPR